MASAEYYRAEAKRCRELSVNSADPAMAERWRALAADYETLAEALEGPPIQSQPQQQPMQQQQHHLKKPDT